MKKYHMNYPCTEVPIFPTMINYVSHPSFEKETAALQRRFPKFNDGLDSFKRIAEEHFHPITPQRIIAPAKLHRRKALEVCVIWKIELAVQGLKSNQFPRVWFAVSGSTIAFLSANTHIDNYDDNDIDRIAEHRATDIF